MASTVDYWGRSHLRPWPSLELQRLPSDTAAMTLEPSQCQCSESSLRADRLLSQPWDPFGRWGILGVLAMLPAHYKQINVALADNQTHKQSKPHQTPVSFLSPTPTQGTLVAVGAPSLVPCLSQVPLTLVLVPANFLGVHTSAFT